MIPINRTCLSKTQSLPKPTSRSEKTVLKGANTRTDTEPLKDMTDNAGVTGRTDRKDVPDMTGRKDMPDPTGPKDTPGMTDRKDMPDTTDPKDTRDMTGREKPEKAIIRIKAGTKENNTQKKSNSV